MGGSPNASTRSDQRSNVRTDFISMRMPSALCFPTGGRNLPPIEAGFHWGRPQSQGAVWRPFDFTERASVAASVQTVQHVLPGHARDSVRYRWNPDPHGRCRGEGFCPRFRAGFRDPRRDRSPELSRADGHFVDPGIPRVPWTRREPGQSRALSGGVSFPARRAVEFPCGGNLSRSCFIPPSLSFPHSGAFDRAAHGKRSSWGRTEAAGPWPVGGILDWGIRRRRRGSERHCGHRPSKVGACARIQDFRRPGSGHRGHRAGCGMCAGHWSPLSGGCHRRHPGGRSGAQRSGLVGVLFGASSSRRPPFGGCSKTSIRTQNGVARVFGLTLTPSFFSHPPNFAETPDLGHPLGSVFFSAGGVSRTRIC
jgi:hypothetical protein